MVVFACGACGESLKKNQVETHYYRKCRNCNVLSCLDCGKDFWGSEYEAHTKCITEEEKYSGKNYVPKPGQNKNEIKQLQWVQQVQDAVDKCQTNPRLKGILIRLKDQSNIPRKKNKFLNFLANGFNVRDDNLANQVWEMLMTNTANQKQEEKTNKTEAEKDSKDLKQQTDDESNKLADSLDAKNSVSNGTGENSVKLSKRDKKEERRKKSNKKEKKDKVLVGDGDSLENGESEKNSKKKKKRKDSESTESNKKSKKRKREEDEDIEETGDMNSSAVVDDDVENEEDEDDEVAQPAKKKFKTKFNWNEVVIEVLESKGPELKIKKLKKKVLSEYLAQGCTEKSEEKLWATFDKKLKKIPEVKIVGDKVKLKNPS